MSTIPTPAERAWLDQDDAHVADTIRRHGVCLQLIGIGACAVPGCPCTTESKMPFGYTIGLFGIAHPELVVVGLGMPTVSSVLNSAARLVLDGARLTPGETLELPCWDRQIVIEQVPNPGYIAFGANRHYQRPAEASVPLLQLTYTDPRGRYPWDRLYAGARRRQPRPGEWDAR
ncbi:DUF4262 domain-containing protein [Microbacterium protaetiae]|uniref:DUF4262 domain-containing protein n=1 Tax=Microbacterium protaetiae TaxID=2509458 RepID=A0A4P6EFH6_9MICO|nr:DUF4262 domain-containing protein [Microbacterium protaetiae]QAY59889.1 DUF4262 domain-containing protein [Microbacterium protaetiae]